MHPIINRITEIFNQRGHEIYADEDVTQLQHALQCAELAKIEKCEDQLIAAALLHDIGHILGSEELPANCQDDLDDDHETRGFHFLLEHFGPAVADPVRLHVPAKRYLCTTESEYQSRLSPTSLKSFLDQGGLMSDEEIQQFKDEPWFEWSIKLRRWDDLAKDGANPIDSVEIFVPHLESALALASNPAG